MLQHYLKDCSGMRELMLFTKMATLACGIQLAAWVNKLKIGYGMMI